MGKIRFWFLCIFWYRWLYEATLSNIRNRTDESEVTYRFIRLKYYIVKREYDNSKFMSFKTKIILCLITAYILPILGVFMEDEQGNDYWYKYIYVLGLNIIGSILLIRILKRIR